MADKPTTRMIAEQKAKAAKQKRLNPAINTDAYNTGLSDLEKQIADKQSTIDNINRTNAAHLAYGTGKSTDSSAFGGNYGSYNRYGEAKRAGDLQGELDTLNKRLSYAKENPSSISSKLALSGQFDGKMGEDMMRGAKFGETILGEEGLGRLSEDADIQEVMQRYKDISEKGMDSGELAFKKADLFEQVDAQGETARRNLQAQLARAGVKGGLAGKQIASSLMDTAGKKSDISRDLFIQNAEAQRQGLKDYSERLGQVKTFDLGQAADEKNLILQAGFGQAQLGSSERGAKYAAEQAKLAAQARSDSAPSCFRAGTVIDGKKIEDIKVGDIINNDMVTGVMKLRQVEPFYLVDGIYVTGSHYIYDNEEWKRVSDSPVAIETSIQDKLCYSLRTLTGTIIINDVMFGDYDGINDDEMEDYVLDRMNDL